MKYLLTAFALLILTSCYGQRSSNHSKSDATAIILNQQDLKNEKVRNYKFLEGMYADSYFPKPLVDKVKIILLEFCFNIEKDAPKNLDELYKLSHAATGKINDLQGEFAQHQTEIETAAREVIAIDFDFISSSYGFKADVEELISNRDW